MGILGHPIRIVPTGAGEPTARLYLTFDDGPHPQATPAVLEVLARHGAPATFFLVGQRAAVERGLVADVLRAGHAIGNHSSDHGYGHFFRGRRHLRDWVADSEALLEDVTGRPTAGFRPPAGVRTPELGWALAELGVPLVMWRVRFFDAVVPWRPLWAHASLRMTPPGAIVLLHDGQPAGRLPGFLATLDSYLAEARQRGFIFAALSRTLLQRPS
jgi:peptidoglycan/xylan/chitin deacetylase (PgdA/CDA1 family)